MSAEEASQAWGRFHAIAQEHAADKCKLELLHQMPQRQVQHQQVMAAPGMIQLDLSQQVNGSIQVQIPMSELEDLFPEMAGVFATQESAMDNALAVLTQQLQLLATDNVKHVEALQTLHRSQRQLLDSQQQLQRALAVVQSRTQTQAAELEALRTSTQESRPDLSSLQVSLEKQAEGVVVRHLQSMENKLMHKMDERLLETSNRAYLQAQQTEEAMKLQIELLEKKFEYLSRVKMEIKDVTKRMEKQDQEIDDMRTSLALLVKSVGTDEIDDEDDNGEDEAQRNGAWMSAASTAREATPAESAILALEQPAESQLPSISEGQTVESPEEEVEGSANDEATADEAPQVEDSTVTEDTSPVDETIPAEDQEEAPLSPPEEPPAMDEPEEPTVAEASLPEPEQLAVIDENANEAEAERSAKRQSGARKELSDEGRETRLAPLSKEVIRELWNRVFTKLVQLRRLQSIHGGSAERSLFRKQNMSMGARVKRLEEATTDIEDTMEMLEGNLRTTQQVIDSIGQHAATIASQADKKSRKLEEVQQMHDKALLGLEEKLEAFEAEIRRMRTSSRRDSSQGSFSSAMMSQVASQLHDLNSRVTELSTAYHATESTVRHVIEADIASLGSRTDQSIKELRYELESKTKEQSKDFTRWLQQMESTRATNESQLENRLATALDEIYRDMLVLTSSLLFAVDLLKQNTSSPSKSSRQNNPFFVAVSLLQNVFSAFQASILPLQQTDLAATVTVLVEKVNSFNHDLTKLKEQARQASALATANASASQPTGSLTSTFEDHLVLLLSAQLRSFEGLLASQSKGASDDAGATLTLTCHMKDLVLQFRAVLFLVSLNKSLMEPREQIAGLKNAQDEIRQVVMTHEFALGQFATIESLVKMMNARLDSFVDLTFSFAKDSDVKKSMQEILAANDEFRALLSSQLDATNADAVKRDELLEREVTQLVGRVNKKLDKDEMLWTQEVLERKLQSVAKSALGEEDLRDIHHALRSKLDRSQFHALLEQQHAKLLEMSGNGNGGPLMQFLGAGGSDQPLVAAKCISCNGEVPPTKTELRAAVKEEVEHQVAKLLAKQHQQQQHMMLAPAPSSPMGSPTATAASFNAAEAANNAEYIERCKQHFFHFFILQKLH
ncbi:hypothetical protein P43SY_004766 [Pythium insidiosum]|uniref:Uncharacterized protein n=1 Tax=Pythium insidiosum TaxID=114742 RepID=A0AAD5LRT7_PYTIN|nr:hypothetical protein P43SY_004766 [Pythium insidiosum]